MKKLLIITICLPFAIFAQYTLTSNDVTFENGIIKDYLNTTEKDIIIPDEFSGESVIEIGNNAFSQNELTGVIIPSTVETIGNQAFSGNRLTTVTIPDAVTTIGTGAFSGGMNNNQLTSVVIGKAVTSIGSFTFTTNKLTNVIIPNSVTSIGLSAFSDNQITNLTLGNSVTTIENRAFYGNKLTNLVIPNTVTNICDWAFNQNQLTNITFDEGLSTIGDYAFSGNKLNGITLPNSVTFIGEQAFGFNQFSSFNLPSAHQGHSYSWNNGNYNSGDNVDVSGEYEIFEKAEETSSINKIEKTLDFYPNPSSDFINVKSNEKTEVYSIDGVLKLTSIQSKIDLSNLTTGVYIIKLGNKTAKFIKK